ncbi:MAG: hypothetical protein WB621_06010, partial [Candidatus Acidiferrales bacterium]
FLLPAALRWEVVQLAVHQILDVIRPSETPTRTMVLLSGKNLTFGEFRQFQALIKHLMSI